MNDNTKVAGFTRITEIINSQPRPVEGQTWVEVTGRNRGRKLEIMDLTETHARCLTSKVDGSGGTTSIKIERLCLDVFHRGYERGGLVVSGFRYLPFPDAGESAVAVGQVWETPSATRTIVVMHLEGDFALAIGGDGVEKKYALSWFDVQSHNGAGFMLVTK